MRSLSRWLAALLVLACAAALTIGRTPTLDAQTPVSDNGGVAEDEAPWPRLVMKGGDSIWVYQPQLDKWQDNKLEGRSAVSITRSGAMGTKPDCAVVLSFCTIVGSSRPLQTPMANQLE